MKHPRSPCCKADIIDNRDLTEFWLVTAVTEDDDVESECVGSTDQSDHVAYRCRKCDNVLSLANGKFTVATG